MFWTISIILLVLLIVGVYVYFTWNTAVACEPEIEDTCGKGETCHSVKKVCMTEVPEVPEVSEEI
jgi:hypothetical protein